MDEDALERRPDGWNALNAGPEGSAAAHANLDKGEDQHDEDARPEEPVTWRRKGARPVREGLKAHGKVVDPVGEVGIVGLADSLTSLDDAGGNNAPSENGPSEEAPRCVDSRQHSGAEERRSEFKDPSIVLDGYCTRPAQLEQRPSYVPVKEDTGDIAVQHLPAEAHGHGDPECLCFHFGNGLPGWARMQRPDRKGGGSWGREDKTLAQNEVCAQRDHEEYTEVSACHGQSNQSANNGFRSV